MSNWQLFVSAGLPTATGLVGIVLALILNGRVESRLDRMQADLSQFYMMLGEHKGKLEILEKK